MCLGALKIRDGFPGKSLTVAQKARQNKQKGDRMISGIDLNVVEDFTLKDDKENPTIWKLGTFSSYVHGQLGAMDQKDAAGNAFLIARIGIKGWENFKVNDFDIEFGTVTEKVFGKDMELVSPELIEIIPLPAIMELATKIISLCSLQADEQKN